MNDHVDEALGAYALGALEPDEMGEVERHLATCERCRTELEATEETLGYLPLDLDPIAPSPELKTKILAAVEREAAQTQGAATLPSGTVVPVPESDSRPGRPSPAPSAVPAKPIPIESKRRLPRYLIPALAAAAVVLIVVGVVVSRSRQQSAQQQYAAYVHQARAAGDQVISLKPQGDAAARATLTVTKSGQASLIVGPSAPPPSQRVYQLWYMNLPTTKGVTVYRPSKDRAQVLKLHLSPHGYKLTGVTTEPGPNGSKAPTTTPFLIGNV